MTLPATGRLRVAIVGLGPKGLFALERLVDHSYRLGSGAAIEIDLFEPHPAPGAGPVYDPDQPAYLRMNFAADNLDVWDPQTLVVPADERLSFVDWRAALGRGDQDETYPPRSQVGRYLTDAFACLLSRMPPGIEVALRQSAVRSVHRRGSAWGVVTDDLNRDYDEVLLTIGHQDLSDPSPTGLWDHAAPLVRAVFPVTRSLSARRVAAGATVAIRGFALTFIDAAIALTEGRGGTFAHGDHPYRLRYMPARNDVSLILPFSRTGRPMLAKPDPALAASVGALADIGEDGRDRITALGRDLSVRSDLVEILAATAASSLLAANGQPCDGERRRFAQRAFSRWLEHAAGGVVEHSNATPADQIERSLAVGAGLEAPDFHWALGHTWRSVYPAVVAELGGTSIGPADWPLFLRLATELERVSFGPPPANAAKLLALIAAGRVDLTHLAGGSLVTSDGTTSLRSHDSHQEVDVVVNAVLPQPGALDADDELVGSLIAEGHARVMPGRRGLEIVDDATCIGRGGPSPGLAAMGRVTEDAVIGNDTLSRHLHLHADLWAQRVATRSTQDVRAKSMAAA